MSRTYFFTPSFSVTKKAFEGVGLIPPQPGSMHGGHIPGAVNLSDDDVIDKVTKCMLSPHKLEEGEKSESLYHVKGNIPRISSYTWLFTKNTG